MPKLKPFHSSRRICFIYYVLFDKTELFELIKRECETVRKTIKLCIIFYLFDRTYVYIEFKERIRISNRYFMAFTFKDVFYIPQFIDTKKKVKILEYLYTCGDVVFEYNFNIKNYIEARKKHKKFIKK